MTEDEDMQTNSINRFMFLRRRSMLAVSIVFAIVGFLCAQWLFAAQVVTAKVFLSPIKDFNIVAELLLSDVVSQDNKSLQQDSDASTFILQAGLDADRMYNDDYQSNTSYLRTIAFNILSKEMSRSSVFISAVEKNEDLAKAAAIVPTKQSYQDSIKIVLEEPNSTQLSETVGKYLITLKSRSERVTPFFDAYLKHIKETVSKRFNERIIELYKLRLNVAETNYIHALHDRNVEYANLEKDIIDDVERASKAGFEYLAYNPQNITSIDSPIFENFPKYFEGTRVLQENLRLLRQAKSDETRLDEYIKLQRLKFRFENIQSDLKSINFNIVESYVLPQDDSILDSFKVLVVTMLVSAFGLFSYVVFLSARFLSSKWEK